MYQLLLTTTNLLSVKLLGKSRLIIISKMSNHLITIKMLN